MTASLHDVRQALRSLARDPRFALSAILILAVGIGVNSAVLSVANAYLVRPLPYEEPDRVVALDFTLEGERFAQPQGLLDVDWTPLDGVFEGLAAWDLDAFTLVGVESPEQVPGAWVNPDFFSVLGVEPALGRVFSEAETAVDRGVAVISYDLWRRRFGSDREVIGKSLTVYAVDRPEESELFTIVGVLPADFWHINVSTDILVPLRGRRVPSLALLAPGVGRHEAANRVTEALRTQLPGIEPDWRARVEPLQERYVARVRPTITALLAAVGLVLLIAAANAAILILVRGANRAREFTIRRALGAGRWRLARQLTAEGLLLAVLAGTLGVFLVWVTLDPVSGQIQERLGSRVPGGPGMINLDATVLGGALALSLLTGLSFGLVPLLPTLGRDLVDSLKAGTRTTMRSGGRRLQNALVLSELGISLALLIAAAFVVRGAVEMQRSPLGFRPADVFTASLSLRVPSYPEPDDQLAFFQRVLQEVRALPGVESAALADFRALSRPFAMPVLADVGDGSLVEMAANNHTVNPQYFVTLGIPLLQGRGFADSDRRGSVPVIIISESLARGLWPGEPAIGKRMGRSTEVMGTGDPEAGGWRTVIGVVADVHDALDEPNEPETYIPLAQEPRPFTQLFVRSSAGLALLPTLQRAVNQLDETLPLVDPEMLTDRIARSTAGPRFIAFLLAGFAGFALALAAFGLYAVISYSVMQRRQDIAIRIALGASDGQVAGLFLRQTLPVLIPGLALGLGGGAALTRVVGSQLRGLSPGEPVVYLGAAAVFLLVALLATWAPTRRASRAQPMRVLRDE